LRYAKIRFVAGAIDGGKSSGFGGLASLARLAEWAAIAVLYFVVAKASLSFASINPSATPIWPPTGLALGLTLLRGYPILPAIFFGALAANIATSGALASSAVIAVGNTLEALIGAFLMRRWASSAEAFEAPANIARFAVIVTFLSTPVSATIGVLALTLMGSAAWSSFPAIWATWWLGDAAGAVLVTPALVLWARAWRLVAIAPPHESILVHLFAVVVGALAFSPLLPSTPGRHALAFLAVLPLLWAALRRGSRDTSTVALILSAFAIWGVAVGQSPFTQQTLNASFLLLVSFIASATLPSLALSAAVASRDRALAERKLVIDELNHRVKNVLAVVQSISAQTLLGSPDPKEAYSRLEGRLQALARAHDILTAGGWRGASFHDVVRATVLPHTGQTGGRIAVSGPSVALDPRAALALSMVLHELATNALKYGALSNGRGRVELKWMVKPVLDQSELLLTWSERGGPKLAPPAEKGFGLKMIERTLAAEPGGNVQFEFPPDGLRSSIRLRLSSQNSFSSSGFVTAAP
jgi:two-component sensor histidine kinase